VKPTCSETMTENNAKFGTVTEKTVLKFELPERQFERTVKNKHAAKTYSER